MAAALLAIATAGFVADSACGSDPFQEVTGRARGLLGVDVNVNDGGVGVRVGPLDIRVNDQDRPPRNVDPLGLFLGRQVAGTAITDPRFHEIGRVDDLVVDLRSGKVRYVIVEYSAVSHQGRLFAVPWNRFQLAGRPQADQVLVLNIDPETLERSSGFVRNEWPDLADRRWVESIDIYYGRGRNPGNAGTQIEIRRSPFRNIERLERVSRIGGFPVIGDDSERRIGSIQDVVVDLTTGHARYAVLQFDTPVGPEDRQFMVPFDRFDYETKDGLACLELEVDPEVMARAPNFPSGQWPNLREPGYAAHIDEYFDIEED